jgi:hypothetical protein
MSQKEKPLSNDALAGEFEKGSGIVDLPRRIDRYGAAKSRQLEILKQVHSFVHTSPLHARASNLHRDQYRMQECGNYLVFNHYHTIDQVRLSQASFCMKHLLCPLCAIRRGAKQVKAYLDKLNVLTEKNPRLKPYMLTLTVKNGRDLAERFKHLTQSTRKLMARRRDAVRGKGSSELEKALGGVYSYELTYSKAHGWHPHVHMVVLLDIDNPITFDPYKAKESQLSKEWHKVTGDSFIVDIRPITGDPADGFVEVFKYALKFSDLTPEQNLHAYLTLKGKRLTGSFGAFWGVQVPESMTDDLLDDLPYIRLFYRYTSSGYSLNSAGGGPSGGGTSRFTE